MITEYDAWIMVLLIAAIAILIVLVKKSGP
jgi:hypothetical protein